jgi:hypothetical protein
VVFLLARVSPAVGQTAGNWSEYRQLVDQYCVACHSHRTKNPASAPLFLDIVHWDDLRADRGTWEKVIRKLGVGAMPPHGAPRPDSEALKSFRNWLSASLAKVADEENNPGHFPLHRLNRTEYANAIRDLLGLDEDVTALLPADGSDFGFDNVASALPVTTALLERYLTAAVRISDLAAGNRKVELAEETFPVRLDFTQDAHIEGLPLGTRGGTLVRHNFPVDGEYLLSASLVRPVDNADAGLEGQDTPQRFEILIDGTRIHSALLGGPEDHVASRQNLTAAREAAAARMRVRAFIPAGPHEVGFTFVERPARPQDVFEPALRSSQDIHVGSGAPRLRSVTINGPLAVSGLGDTLSRSRIFSCRPNSSQSETQCAEQIVRRLATRAYRRPATEDDLAPLMKFFRQGRETGDFEGGIRAALPRILSSPSFLFRSEQDPKGLPASAAHAVSDPELASRLSFFLWSSIPDEELLAIASEGRLRAPGVLEQQVRRMLADERSQTLLTNFPDQWLALRNLERVAPDLLLFPNWDMNLREDLHRETLLLFGSIVREDRSALELLNGDYTFVNERLARFYGIPNVYGTEFRRVPVTDPNRRGLLGQGSILALTSVATRTSPVFRGKWILANLLDMPPLPPPPNVPALAENAGTGAPKSVRERLEAHRANPVCASCHRTIDPIGFALENFDAIGQWRATTEDGKPVDASGVLVDGARVDSPIALRNALLSRPDVFVGTVTEKLLTYALGRGLELYDMPVVRRIVDDAARDNYRFQSLILGIVNSRPFQMRAKAVPPEEKQEEK